MVNYKKRSYRPEEFPDGVVTTAKDGVELLPFGIVAGQTGEERFRELLSNGAQYVGFKAPDSIAANVIWVLPSADGTAGQVLSTNGAGVLSWVTRAP